MENAILSGLSGLIAGFVNLHWSNLVMIAIGGLLLWLGIKKDCEPLLLVPIGFGAILVNIPLANLMGDEGFLRTIYNMGVDNELFPLLIFVGIGAMTDFGPVLENPYTFLLRCCRSVRYLFDPSSRPCLRLPLQRGRDHRYHRCLRRSDRHLRGIEVCPEPLGPCLGCGLFVHVLGARAPAAHHEDCSPVKKSARPS